MSFDPDAGFELVRTQPVDLTDFLARGTDVEIGYDTIPTDIPFGALGFEDTDVLIVEDRIRHEPKDDRSTDRMSTRPATDGEWPPDPKPPGTRKFRRAGMFKAITKL